MRAILFWGSGAHICFFIARMNRCTAPCKLLETSKRERSCLSPPEITLLPFTARAIAGAWQSNQRFAYTQHTNCPLFFVVLNWQADGGSCEEEGRSFTPFALRPKSPILGPRSSKSVVTTPDPSPQSGQYPGLLPPQRAMQHPFRLL